MCRGAGAGAGGGAAVWGEAGDKGAGALEGREGVWEGLLGEVCSSPLVRRGFGGRSALGVLSGEGEALGDLAAPARGAPLAVAVHPLDPGLGWSLRERTKGG